MLKIAVSAGLLLLLAWQVDWGAVRGALAHVGWVWLTAALLAFQGAMVLAGVRWQLVASAGWRGMAALSARAAVAATYVSLWLSNFLPTAFGGDVARIVTARRLGVSLPHAVSSALLDRAIGLLTLTLLFVLAEMVMAAAGKHSALLPVAGLLGALLCASAIAAWLVLKVRLSRRWLRMRAVRFLARGSRVLRALAAQPALSARVGLVSVASSLLGVAAYWGAIRCVSSGVGFATALAVAAIGTCASLLPVSLSGWGVREGSVALALTGAGALSAGDASLAALANGGVIALTSLIGLLLSLPAGAAWSIEGTSRLRPTAGA